MPSLLTSHSAAEMQGAGKLLSSFPGDIFGPLIIEFRNGDYPGYFTIEQVTGRDEYNFIPLSTTDYVAGTYSDLSNINSNGIVENPFLFSVALPPGTSSMVFSANEGDGSGQMRLRATSYFDIYVYDQ